MTPPPPSSSDLRFEAVIDEIVDDGLILSVSRFCPGIGGRESDTGTIAGHQIIEVLPTQHDRLFHRLADPSAIPTLAKGERVAAVVDGPRRWTLMRLHTAQHLTYHAFRHVYGPASRVHRTIKPTEAILGLQLDPTVAAEGVSAQVLEDWVRRAVNDDLMISLLPAVGCAGRQYWHVDGIGRLACTGVHPRSTAEVGAVGVEVTVGEAGSVSLRTVLVNHCDTT